MKNVSLLLFIVVFVAAIMHAQPLKCYVCIGNDCAKTDNLQTCSAAMATTTTSTTKPTSTSSDEPPTTTTPTTTTPTPETSTTTVTEPTEPTTATTTTPTPTTTPVTEETTMTTISPVEPASVQRVANAADQPIYNYRSLLRNRRDADAEPGFSCYTTSVKENDDWVEHRGCVLLEADKTACQAVSSVEPGQEISKCVACENDGCNDGTASLEISLGVLVAAAIVKFLI